MATPADEEAHISAQLLSATKDDGPAILDNEKTESAQDAPAELPRTSGSTQVTDFTTRFLEFLSTASNETLTGIAVALVACTYFILGRLGLLLIGTFGGVILHATWGGYGQSAIAGATTNARRETGLDIAKRILDWRETKLRDEDNEQDVENHAITGSGFDDFQPETRAALSQLVEAVLRDYVNWWYQPIIPLEMSFPEACRKTLIGFLRSISIRLSKKRPADTFLDFLTNSSSIVIVFLNELSSAMSASQGTSIKPGEAVEKYLSTNPESNLANILNGKQQKKKFNMIADDLLENFLDKAVYNCDPTRAFLREILGGVVMEMSLTACSKPEWLNGWIVYLLEDGEPDLIQAIDIGMGGTGDTGMSSTKSIEQINSKSTEERRHQRRISKAEEAMEEAMEEAKRLSQLIADDDQKRVNSFRATEATTPEPVPESTAPNLWTAEEQQASYLQSTSKGLNAEPQVLLEKVEVLPETKLLEPGDSHFTSFDQLALPLRPTTPPVDLPKPRRATVSLTLHNANITIDDDSDPKDNGRLGNKPTGEYLVQIEPASSQHPGWMIVRKFQDFETLHEVLKRIAAVSGVVTFTMQHNVLPNWKIHTKASLRGELQRYLRDACRQQSLAESEGMKRFLEKDGLPQLSSGKGGFGWPTPAAFENMGKGMLDVFTSAPKGAAEGGKVMLEGMTGVFGNIGSLGQKKRDSALNLGNGTVRHSQTALPRLDSSVSPNGSRWGRESQENLRAPLTVAAAQTSKTPTLDRNSNSFTEHSLDGDSPAFSRVSMSSRPSLSGRGSPTSSIDVGRPPQSFNVADLDSIVLPPPPSDIPDDYHSPSTPFSAHSRGDTFTSPTRTSTSTVSLQSPSRNSLSSLPPQQLTTPPVLPRRPKKEFEPLSDEETRVAVELLFAVINELYTLSSAWNIRRTLLTAAKTFLLRPGNPSLTSIQSLIQDSLIASNISDEGVAYHLRKLRENSLPTEEELKEWPAEISSEQKEKLRVKARKLLVERGVPGALSGVMGQAATGEAMGRVFDCLQVEEVARGLMFGLLLQGVRAITH